MHYLVTGAAGFIGSAVSHALMDAGHSVFGIDNINDYYDPKLKEARLARLEPREGFRFKKIDICDGASLEKIFKVEAADCVIHLAAQAGVRYSLTNPQAYIDANVNGFLNILEGCRHNAVKHLVYASSSSVYGMNETMPFSVADNVDHPVSLYAATKKSNELMAHCYAHLYRIPVTGLRFFTVYGPWGRPDMALFLFTQNILAGKPIDIFNNGNHARDFTYIDDIVEGVLRVAEKPPEPSSKWSGAEPDPSYSSAPYRLFNIGSNRPIELMDYVRAIENALGIEAKKNFLPMQMGDVAKTYADVSHLKHVTGFAPKTELADGVAKFIDWYRSYYSQ